MDYVIATVQQIGQALEDSRQHRGMTQSELGRLAGLRQPAVSAIESDPSSCKLSRLFPLLAALDLELVLRPRVSLPIPAGEW